MATIYELGQGVKSCHLSLAAQLTLNYEINTVKV